MSCVYYRQIKFEVVLHLGLKQIELKVSGTKIERRRVLKKQKTP